MGLDMYAYITKQAIDTPVDFEVEDSTELHYWRKHPNLHGWMQALYYQKGGRAEFNCVSVQISVEDLDRLETDIRSQSLPDTIGFFFGLSDGSEAEDDLEFIRKAREALSLGFHVYYTSWW